MSFCSCLRPLHLFFVLLGICFSIGMVTEIASAADFSAFCTGVPGGCKIDIHAPPYRQVIQGVGTIMLRVAAGLAVIFIIWAGYLMVLSMGDESRLSQARLSIVYVLAGLLLAFASQTFVAGIATLPPLEGDKIKIDVSLMARAADILLTIFNVFFIFFIIVGGIRMLLARGKPDEFNKARHMIAWVIGGAIILNVARVLVRAVVGIF
ncbi:hypothetical protein A3D11_02900 [Candidatus Peribacteria bacterium RIFCSPHIGHO2_02_FULL_49_16]|nr:MAG: hypothetical protein A2880_01660 [Candidatus Peribacteria bacterium RIFCSPHIGHO2_01_FULL_49_38]OGJ58537.1 MAG: hypothetical protein A3D11_02900 [Candidatus Peribacteria bacterium RIFCSPHIGHO2_02_FULL_49_16]